MWSHIGIEYDAAIYLSTALLNTAEMGRAGFLFLILWTIAEPSSLSFGQATDGRDHPYDDVTIETIRAEARPENFVVDSVKVEFTRTQELAPGARPRHGLAFGSSTKSFVFSEGRFRSSISYDDFDESSVFDGTNSVVVRSQEGKAFSLFLKTGKYRRVEDYKYVVYVMGVCLEKPQGYSTLFPFCLNWPHPLVIDGEYEIVGREEVDGQEIRTLEDDIDDAFTLFEDR